MKKAIDSGAETKVDHAETDNIVINTVINPGEVYNNSGLDIPVKDTETQSIIKTEDSNEIENTSIPENEITTSSEIEKSYF